jgi:crotonobetainyl-CoA:carnitine CoA-transferase CaiB-like acyl-CoA transferase
MLLADLGARVIVVEPPQVAQNLTSTNFPSLQRGKESLVCDLKTDEGQAVFRRLLHLADVVVEGFRPGTLARLGVDYDMAIHVNPRIIYCSITGFGQEGEDAGKAGHDINFLARSGILDLMQPADAPPSIPAVQFADMTGSMMAAIAILAALHERDRTGTGRHLDIPMTDSMLSLAVTSATFSELGWEFGAGKSFVGGGLACYSTYRTNDGQLLAVGALEPGFFTNLCRAIKKEELVPHQYSPSEQPRLRSELEAVFSTRTGEEWAAFFAPLDVCVTVAVPFDEALSEGRFWRTGAVRRATGMRGKSHTVLGLPLQYPECSPDGGAIPRRGAHSTRLLREIGYSNDEIAALLDIGVVE